MDKSGDKFQRRHESIGAAVLRASLENLAHTARNIKQIILMSTDAALSILALWLAYSVRLDSFYDGFAQTWYLFLLVPALTVGACSALGIYRWVVRSSTGMLSFQLVKASAAASIALLIVVFLFPPNDTNPRSLFAIYGLFFCGLSIGARSFWQWLNGREKGQKTGEPVAIFGAGVAGQQLFSLMRLAPEYQPAFFIDDQLRLTNSTVGGLKVYGTSDASLQAALDRHEVTRIVIAAPSLKGKDYTDVLQRLAAFSLPIQTTPSVTELVDGRASADEIRDISIEDLLGRNQIEPDNKLIRQCIEGKNILVSGGGGSIGSEICRQIANYSANKLVILDQSEENLYKISEEIHQQIQRIALDDSNVKVPLFVPMLGSVTNKKKLSKLFATHDINTIFHAAAYKHVPIVEQYPEEGINVNVFGTKTVLDMAVEHEVETFVLISTDKAVRPTNAMGASKRVAEMVLQSKAAEKHNTTICMVRFGNVLGSSGSVVPKFSEQIRAGGPVTLTHPDITRYFMTIPEASQLVLQASGLARRGDVFVLDMDEPVKIIDLAKNMIKLFGAELKSESRRSGIEIKITGLRPGEKLFEELFITGSASETSIPKILREKKPSFDSSLLHNALDELQAEIDVGDYAKVKKLILELAWKFDNSPGSSKEHRTRKELEIITEQKETEENLPDTAALRV